MQKTFLIFFALIFRVSSLYAQQNMPDDESSRFFIRLGFGYAFTQAGSSYNPWSGVYSGSTSNLGSSNQQYFTNIEEISFSKGLHGYLAGGYMITKNVGFELCADLGLYNKKYSSTAANVTSQTTGAIENINVTQQAHSPLLLNPSIILQTGGKIWNLYSRIGIALPVLSSIDENTEFIYTDPASGSVTSDDVLGESLKTKFSPGYTGAIGLSFRYSKSLKFWAEANMLSLALNADEIDIKSAFTNGQNIYSNLSSTVFIFRPSGNSPAAYMLFSVPFSYIGFNAGLAWNPSLKRRTKNHITPNKYHK